MISVEEALGRILSALEPCGAETVHVADGFGRVLAEDVVARVTQPPAAVSAMDGYALRGADLRPDRDTSFHIVGSARAGHRYDAPVGPGECVRIMTGAVMPAGTDTVVVQEIARRKGEFVHVPAGEQGDLFLQRHPIEQFLHTLRHFLCTPGGRVVLRTMTSTSSFSGAPYLVSPLMEIGRAHV